MVAVVVMMVANILIYDGSCTHTHKHTASTLVGALVLTLMVSSNAFQKRGYVTRSFEVA